MAAKAKEKKTVPQERQIRFGKGKILQSRRYARRVDLLGVLLEEGKQYTFAEVDALLDTFMKGKVAVAGFCSSKTAPTAQRIKE